MKNDNPFPPGLKRVKPPPLPPLPRGEAGEVRMVIDNLNICPFDPPSEAERKRWADAQLYYAKQARREAVTKRSGRFRDAGFFLLGVAVCLLYTLFLM